MQNISVWCHHVYSSCVSAKQRWMARLPCLASQCAKLHVVGWKRAVSHAFIWSRVGELWRLSRWIRERNRECASNFVPFLGKSATKTLTTIQQDLGEKSLSRTQVFQWHTRFKTRRTSVDDDEHTGRATSWRNPETVVRIEQLVSQERRRTIREISDEVEVGYGTCQRVLTEKLGMHRVAVKFVHLYMCM